MSGGKVVSIRDGIDALRPYQRAVIDRLRKDLSAPVSLPKRAGKRNRYKLPRAAQAIPWGVPDRDWGRRVCLSIEDAMPPTQPWRYKRRNPIASLAGWAIVVVVCLVVIAAGTVVNSGRGSDERTNVSNVQL